MPALRVRKRHRLRQKEIEGLSSQLDAALGASTFGVDDTVDKAETPDFEIVFVDGVPLAIVADGEAFLTVRGLLKYGAKNRYVTVDMGAVPFVANGADIMGPGVVDADPDIGVGDLVWIRDEKNLRPLAIGRASATAAEMRDKPKGKVVSSIHHVGDRLWLLDEDSA